MTPARVVEPPPAAYADGPTLTGKTWEMVLPDVRQVDYLCRLFMGPPPTLRPGSYHLGCYSTKLDAVVLVARNGWPNHGEWEALRRHEWAHARGWRHNPDGHGTGPNSVVRQTVLADGAETVRMEGHGSGQHASLAGPPFAAGAPP